MSGSTLLSTSVANQVAADDTVHIEARLTSREALDLRLDVEVRDLRQEGFDVEMSRPLAASELFDVAFRTAGELSPRLRVRVVESNWLAVRGRSVLYLTRFQFVHADAPATQAVIERLTAA